MGQTVAVLTMANSELSSPLRRQLAAMTVDSSELSEAFTHVPVSEKLVQAPLIAKSAYFYIDSFLSFKKGTASARYRTYFQPHDSNQETNQPSDHDIAKRAANTFSHVTKTFSMLRTTFLMLRTLFPCCQHLFTMLRTLFSCCAPSLLP
jgi:hypothetical protein